MHQPRYTATSCKCYIGHAVRVHTAAGIREGVVEKVSSKGMHLRPTGPRHASADDGLQAELIFYGRPIGRPYGYGGYGYGYNPARFFVPFLSILALTSLLF